MSVERYALKSESSQVVFRFVSKGPKGDIQKLIDFQEIDEPNMYNLAFGDENPETGAIDDLAVSNNGDSDKVLGTVVWALYRFFDNFPDALVYATGSTEARTRLYRMGITRYYNQMTKDFYLFGLVGETVTKFEVGKDYKGFLIKRKFLIDSNEKIRRIR